LKYAEPTPADDAIAFAVVQAATEVHRALGPGFLESVYEAALCIELETRRVPFSRQQPLEVWYKGRSVGLARLDILVGERLIVELKAVDALLPLHLAQVLSYLKATNLDLGLLIDFNVPLLKDGIKRVKAPDSWRRGGVS
jgi:GxxExxY protein